MIKKIRYILILSFVFLIFFYTKSQARITTNDPSTSSGGTVTITVNSQEKVASGAIKVTSNGGLTLTSASGGQVNGSLVAFAGTDNKTSGIAKYTFKVPNVTKTQTYKVVFTSQDMANADGEPIDSSSATATVTVKAKSSSTTGDGGNSSSSTKPTFTSTNKKVYAKDSINLRSSWSTSSSATPVSKGTEMTLTGTSSKAVNGYVWYRVSYKGTTKYVASSLVTTTKPAESSDKKDDQKDDKKDDQKDNNDENKANSINLKSLSVTPTGLSPVFTSGTTEYTMTVGANTDKIDVKAVAEDKNASVEVTGNTGLKIGNNKITITVTGANKEKKLYHINVTKENKKQLQLSELLIEGLPLEPEFDSNIYEYHLTLDKSDVSELNITATPSQKSAKAEIVGNTGLKPGENVVTILVKSSDEEDITTYQITVTIPSTNVVGTEEKSDNKDIYKYVGIGVGVLIVLIILIVIVKKHGNKKEDDMYYGMYHADRKEENDDDLPKSLRKETVDIKDNVETEKTNNTNYMDAIQATKKKDEDSQTRIDRSKKLDEIYHIEDELQSRKKGKHSK